MYLLLLHACPLLGLLFDPEGGGDMFLRNVGQIFNELHDIVSQNIVEFSITTAVIPQILPIFTLHY
jgi:hypothetical protein